VEEMKKKEERNEKLMAEVMAENKRLSEPLHAALNECELLKKQVQNYEKDKMALRNTKGRLKLVEDQYKELEWQHEVLRQRFGQLEKERDELKAKFVEKLVTIQQKTGLKSMILEKKVQSLQEDLEKKDAQVKAQMPVPMEEKLKARKEIEQLIDAKNAEIKRLQLQIAQIRV
jgi:chromosome segregation ATPase